MATFTDDMSIPVTRGELREELQQFKVPLEQRLDGLEQRLEQTLEQKLAHLATRADLETWGGVLLARIGEEIARSEQRLLTELARHTRAIQESMSTQIFLPEQR